MQDWQSSEMVEKTERMAREVEEQDAKARRQKDAENISYMVWDGVKAVLTTPDFHAASRLARSIKAKLYWCIEGAVVNEVEDNTEKT